MARLYSDMIGTWTHRHKKGNNKKGKKLERKEIRKERIRKGLSLVHHNTPLWHIYIAIHILPHMKTVLTAYHTKIFSTNPPHL